MLDRHSTVGMTPVNAGANPAPAPGDILTMLPARSVVFTMMFGFAPSR
jgi:hypothetical protein